MNPINQTPADISCEGNSLAFVFRQMLSRCSFVELAQVTAITGSTLTVRRFVNPVDASGKKINDTDLIYNVPFMRLQHGQSAVIMNPSVGDVGLILVCDRDISLVKSSGAQAIPGSKREHNLADAVYLGGIGLLNPTPTQYIEFADGGITIMAPNGMHIIGPVTTTSTITAAGDIRAGNISVENHAHGGVQSGGSLTSGPQ
ncbi:Gp138 family membrane-puncturing spike protein [Dickeya poaceiphila]|uniref:Uncharacterized protein n=1 Tax=Dickeya poaceiphila TaxID=568768 RepID=A0A5B8I4P9_9GAMM|nr:Gp138 family membrane-puncturing spike protein [Dickeya poaceiphila]QDX29563.1 hypothetical protein Dpoa569_0001348 [Dickeya poaceiphila]